MGVRDFIDLLMELPERARWRAATGPEGQLWTPFEEWCYSLLETVSITATADTRLRKPFDLTRPRYPDRIVAGPPSDPADVAAFFGMVYMPERATDD